MSRTQVHTPRKPVLAGIGATAVLVTAAALVPGSTPAEAATYSPPPAHAGFDYQIGGAYTPRPVSRWSAATTRPPPRRACTTSATSTPSRPSPAPRATGTTTCCCATRTATSLRHRLGRGVPRHPHRRQARAHRRAGRHLDRRLRGQGLPGRRAGQLRQLHPRGDLLDAADAQGLIKLLAERAHADGLAIGQKNTVELAPNRKANGLDFAVAEECGEWDECGDYTDAFGDRVIVIEYTAKGLSKACAGFGDELSIVRRDLDVSPKGSSGYVRETC